MPSHCWSIVNEMLTSETPIFFFSHFNCFFILYLWSCVFTCLKLHYWLWSQAFFLIVTSHLMYYSLHMVYFNVKRNHYLQSNLVKNFGNVKDWKTFNVKLLRLSWKIFFITENFKYVEISMRPTVYFVLNPFQFLVASCLCKYTPLYVCKEVK